MQVYLLGAYSPTLSELFRNLDYETHPDLWHLLVWLAAQVVHDPVSMQVVHIVLAAAVWLLVWRFSPFPAVDKILLLLSYVLFFEYFVLSRNYVLVALAGFAVIAVRSLRPRAVLMQFVLLGVLANTMVLGTIWSMVMAARLVVFGEASLRTRLAGGAIYLAALGAALLSIVPAPDTTPYGAHLRFDPTHFNNLALIPMGALFPLDLQWLVDGVRFVFGPAGTPPPRFWNPNSLHGLLAMVGGWNQSVIIGALLSPLILCWLIVRDWKLVAEFTLTYFGIVAFASLWDFPGLARHHGIVFVVFVGTVWLACAGERIAGWREWLWRALLVVSAGAGLLTLAAEARPFSNGYNAAQWLKRNNLADAFILGSRDTAMSTISGYLDRPLYYLECECAGTFIVWNTRRTLSIETPEILRRTERALAGRSGDAILIVNHSVTPEELQAAPALGVTLLQSFTGAVEPTEDYFIFRVSLAR